MTVRHLRRDEQGALVWSDTLVPVSVPRASTAERHELARALAESLTGLAALIRELTVRVEDAGEALLDLSRGDPAPMDAALADLALLRRAVRSIDGTSASWLGAADEGEQITSEEAAARRAAEASLDRLEELRRQARDDLMIHAARTTEQQDVELRRLAAASVALGQKTRDLSRLSLQRADESKKVSSWAAILFAPTLIGTVYGMNFRHMPELDFVYGYPLAVGAMVLMGVALWFIFRRRGWL